jgi:hypothetical protein
VKHNECPACASSELVVFYEVKGVPVNSVLLLESRERAVRFPVADIQLARCQACGFVFNACFDARMTEYSGRYESTQAFSATFARFTEDLTHDLIGRHGIRNKTVV